MGRIREGWELTKKSWGLLRGNPQLFKFVIYGALAALAVTVVFFVPGVVLIDDDQRVAGGVLAAIGIYGATFLSIYFGVGLAASADALFHDRPTTFGDGMAVARSHTAAIAGWAALSALIGLIVATLQRSGSIGEAIIGSLIGAAWSLITFMSIPVIAFEGTGPWGTLKRSATLFKDRWAGQVTGGVAIGGIVFLLGVLPAVLLIGAGGYLWLGADSGGAGLAGGAVLVVVGAVLLVVSMLIAQAMRSVFAVALYRFATGGEVPAAFTEDELRSAVRTR